MFKLLNRLPLGKKFAVLGILGLLLVSAPFSMYVHESSKAIAATQREAQGIAPTKLLLRVLQLMQQHRGMSALYLNGNDDIQARRSTKMDEVDRAGEVFGAYIGKQIDSPAVAQAWRQTWAQWLVLKEKVTQKAISGQDSFAAHNAMIKSLLDVNEALLDFSGMSFDQTFEGSYLVNATLVAMPSLAEMFGQMRAKGTGILAGHSATADERAGFAAMIGVARQRYEKLNVALDKAASADPALKGRLAQASQAALGGADKVIQLAQKEIVQTDQYGFSSTEFFNQYTEAIDAQFKLNDAAMVVLEDMLNSRISRLTNNNYLLSLAILAIFASAALIGVAICRGLIRQLGGEPDYAAAVVGKIAAGDLTVDIALKENDHASLLFAMKSMRDSLTRVIGQIQQGATHIASASQQIAAGNQDLSGRTEQQAGSLEETAASMEELNATVRQTGDNARQANQLAVSASEVAQKGGVVVAQVVGTMNSINDSAKKIVDIISVIDGIAFQTNILALNAAVEAARAGEQGRGFAVVAAEVRNLAQRSAAAAKEIKTLISDSVEKVEAGSKLVDHAGATMAEIVASVRRVNDIMAEIAASTQEQTSGIAQVHQAIAEMDSTTQQNAALVEQAAAAAASLQEQAHRQTALVSQFRLDGEHGQALALVEAPHEVIELAAQRAVPARRIVSRF